MSFVQSKLAHQKLLTDLLDMLVYPLDDFHSYLLSKTSMASKLRDTRSDFGCDVDRATGSACEGRRVSERRDREGGRFLGAS